MSATDPVIALDAMGGDYAPGEIVAGAVEAARKLGVKVALVGPQEVIVGELAKHGERPEEISIIHAPEVIGMDESPAQASRQKKESSIVVGLKMLKEGTADAFVSAGNTGAIMASSIMYLTRIRGIERPSIAGLMPLSGKLTVLLDVGANADARPSYIVQWAQMAAAYMERVWKRENPSVALLNIGEEASKGSTLAQETYELLERSGLNFIGNVEGRDVPFGTADVIVTDGFTGNVVVKTMEGMADYILGEMRSAIKSRPWYMAAGAVLIPAFGRVRKKTDYREYGAGPLLGVNGLVFIGHGRSDAKAIESALRVAAESAKSGMLEAIREIVPAGADVADDLATA
ncbi:MAG TPA: phosphate acyltransferase PlsX [Dehalococcoidia bacterium]|nr:phosphate acyltransferase PlsX [Dehalococcoidia bacterium]